MGIVRQGVAGERVVHASTFLALVWAIALPWPALGLAVPLHLGSSLLRAPSFAQAPKMADGEGGFVPYETSQSAGASEESPAPAPEPAGSPAQPSEAPAPAPPAPSVPATSQGTHASRVRDPVEAPGSPPWDAATMGLQLLGEIGVGVGAGVVGTGLGLGLAYATQAREWGAIGVFLLTWVVVTGVLDIAVAPYVTYQIGQARGGRGSLGWTYAGYFGGLLVDLALGVFFGAAVPYNDAAAYLLTALSIGVTLAGPIVGYHASYASEEAVRRVVRLPERLRRVAALAAVLPAPAWGARPALAAPVVRLRF